MIANHVATPDMFGQAQITSHDLYAWLLCVPRIDPASADAGRYVRGYSVIEKIARAKSDGSFDAVLTQAMENPRFLQLLEVGLPERSLNDLFRPQELPQVKVPRARVKLRRNRPKAVIQAERARLAAEREERRRGSGGLLCRLPSGVPSLGRLLAEVGNPSPFYLARAMHVPTKTAAKWIEEDNAPRSVMLALFWLTKWGVSMIEADAHNAAVLSAQVAASSLREVDALRDTLGRVERIADFGSANDPLPGVRSMHVHGLDPLPTGDRSGGALGANATKGDGSPRGPGGCNPHAGERSKRGPEASFQDEPVRYSCAG